MTAEIVWNERPQSIEPLSEQERSILRDLFTNQIRSELLQVDGAKDIDFVLDNAISGLIDGEPQLHLIKKGKSTAGVQSYNPYPILEWKDKRLVDLETLKESQIGKDKITYSTSRLDELRQTASYETPASQVVIHTTGLKNPDQVQRIYDGWEDIVNSSEGIPEPVKKAFKSKMSEISYSMKPLFADFIFSAIYENDHGKVDRESLGKITIAFSLDRTARIKVAGGRSLIIPPEQTSALLHLVHVHTVGNELE